MPYIKATTVAGQTVMIEKYYSSRWGRKGIERSANLKKTSEEQELVNQRQAIRTVTLLLNANFGPDDYHLVLDYTPDQRPATPCESQEVSQAIPWKTSTALSKVRDGTKIHRSV